MLHCDNSAPDTNQDIEGWASGEYGEDSGGECGIVYKKRFNMPNGTSSSLQDYSGGFSDGGHERPSGDGDVDDGFKPYYSVDTGPVHLVIISIETDFTNGSFQHHWIDADLKAVDRSKTPWVSGWVRGGV